MRKAFTLVELAIVLVIIGLIMGMVIKGKSLIQVARVTAELAKIKRFEVAAATYYTKTGGTLPKQFTPAGNAGRTSYVPKEVFYSLGITDADFNFNLPGFYTGDTMGPYSWMIFRCGHDTNNNPYPYLYNIYGTTGASGSLDMYLCIGQARYDNNMVKEPSGMSRTMVCHMEVALDDSSVISGDGRTMPGWAGALSALEPKYNDCGYEDNDAVHGNGLAYLYRLF